MEVIRGGFDGMAKDRVRIFRLCGDKDEDIET